MKGILMGGRTADRQAINSLINGWMYRDIGAWDKLLGLFHDDGIIEVTWFEGLFKDFVTASRRMSGSAITTKHLIGTPIITWSGTRAIAETNAMIIADSTAVPFGCSVHNRFYDWVERRNGVWKIAKRQSIYDMGSFLFPLGAVPIDEAMVARYPRAYAPLGCFLETSGFPVARVFATKNSDLEHAMRAQGEKWLRE